MGKGAGINGSIRNHGYALRNAYYFGNDRAQKVITVCKDCKRRRVGCHAKCEEYNAQKAAHEAERQARQKDILIESYKADGRQKWIKWNNWKG